MPNTKEKVSANRNENGLEMQAPKSEMLWSYLGGFSRPKDPATAKSIANKDDEVVRQVVYNCDNGFEFSRRRNDALDNARQKTPDNGGGVCGTTRQNNPDAHVFNQGHESVAESIVSIESGGNHPSLLLAQIDQQSRQSLPANPYGDRFQPQKPETRTYSSPDGSPYGFGPANGDKQKLYQPMPGTPRRPPPLQIPQTPRGRSANDCLPRMSSSLMTSRIPMAQLSRTPNVPIVPIEPALQNGQFSQIGRHSRGLSEALGSPFGREDSTLDNETSTDYDTQTSELAPIAKSFKNQSTTTSQDSAPDIRQTNSKLITSQAARERWNIARWHPPPDDNLPATDTEKLDYVLRVESAMLSAHTAEDNPTSTHLKRWIEPVYPADDIRAAAWMVVEATIVLHTHGSTLPIYAFEKTVKHGFVQKDLMFNERMQQICQCLATRKTQCTFVMSNDTLKIQNMIAAPMRTAYRCMNNNLANNRKAKRLAYTAGLDGSLKESRKGKIESLDGEEFKASTLQGAESKRLRGSGRRNAVSLSDSGHYESVNTNTTFQNGPRTAWRSQVEQDLPSNQNQYAPASNIQPEGMDLCLQTPNFDEPLPFSSQHSPGNAREVPTRVSLPGLYGSASGSDMQVQGLPSDEFRFDFADAQFITDLDMMIAANAVPTASFPQNQFLTAPGALQQDLTIENHHLVAVLTKRLDPHSLENIQGEERKHEGEHGNGHCKLSKTGTMFEHQSLTADQQAGSQVPFDEIMAYEDVN